MDGRRISSMTHPPRLPLVAASILAADFAHLADDCRAALDAGADALHLDVMDGHFVPNLTMGPALCKSLRAALPDVLFDVHMMVEQPGPMIQPFADAGADHYTVHIEVVDDPPSMAEQIREAGMTAGLAINPPTDVEAILPYVEHFDLILVMSVNPGFAGQGFIHSVLEKAKVISARLRDNQRLEFDGGVNPQTAGPAQAAGGDVLVAASAIFKASDYADAIAQIRNAPGSTAASSARQAPPAPNALS